MDTVLLGLIALLNGIATWHIARLDSKVDTLWHRVLKHDDELLALEKRLPPAVEETAR